jgi:hypothetical protein
MGLARERTDVLAEEIAAMPAAERLKLLSALMERDGKRVDWSMIAGLRQNLSDTPELRREINETVREARRERTQRKTD